MYWKFNCPVLETRFGRWGDHRLLCIRKRKHSGPAHAGDCAHTPPGSVRGRMRWAQLLKRVFDIDIAQCPHCGGQLKLIAAIEEPAAIARILTHLGLAAQPPPRAPAVRVDLLQAA